MFWECPQIFGAEYSFIPFIVFLATDRAEAQDLNLFLFGHPVQPFAEIFRSLGCHDHFRFCVDIRPDIEVMEQDLD